MLINYRYYTARDILEILSRERIHFSRRNSAIQQPDVITLDPVGEGPFPGGTVTITCETYNNHEAVREILERNYFIQDKAAPRHYKCWTIPFKYTRDSGKLLDDIVACFNEALNSVPFCLYASPAQKALVDYHDFMKGNLPRTGYYDIKKYLGYSCQEGVADEDNMDSGLAYIVARYRNDGWGAWISGDLIVPLFSSEREAIAFLKTRARHISINPVTVRTISARRTPETYILADRMANKKEKLAWLQGEINRLRGLETGCLPDSGQRGKVMLSAAN